MVQMLTTLLAGLRVSETGEFTCRRRACVAFRDVSILLNCGAFRDSQTPESANRFTFNTHYFGAVIAPMNVKQMCRTNGKLSGTHAWGT